HRHLHLLSRRQRQRSIRDRDGFLLYSYGNQNLPEGLLQQIDADSCMRKLEIMLPATPLFNMAFRYNSGRALLMGVRKSGRQPLWMQRLKSAEMLEQVVRRQEHPLIRETRRECMQELWDAKGVQELLYDIRCGAVAVREIYTDIPSPMSLPLQWSQEAAVMYDYAPTPRGIHGAVEEALKKEKHLIQPGSQELMEVQERSRLPQDEKQLHSLLMTEGDLAAGELDIPVEWLESLAQEGRVLYLEQGLWIAAEQEKEYAVALGEEETAAGQEERLHIVRRMLRYRGGADVTQTATRYGWSEQVAKEILDQLCRQSDAVRQDGRYYHAKLYSRARVRTLKNRREEIQTCPGENYAALMLSRTESGAPAEECLRNTLRQYAGMIFPAAYWESIFLPRRVRNFRESMLDTFLAQGELFWHMEEKGGLRFDYQEDIDWEADLSGNMRSKTEIGLDSRTETNSRTTLE
ncbi:MAG: DEAD/DEAH box helicase, partial [Lachnospiraceae bacterium]|nr:DEAD/DEAH box helicase [Lachnospiraceae bacterium]